MCCIISSLIFRNKFHLEPCSEVVKSLLADKAVKFVDNVNSFPSASREISQSYLYEIVCT